MTVSAELFAQFLYNPELTFADLHSHEEKLMTFVEEELIRHNATFINFEAVGDTLRVQCQIPSYSEDACHSLCEVLAPKMDGNIEGRLLFVPKDLSLISVYTLAEKVWKEACTELPYAGAIGRHLFLIKDYQ